MGKIQILTKGLTYLVIIFFIAMYIPTSGNMLLESPYLVTTGGKTLYVSGSGPNNLNDNNITRTWERVQEQQYRCTSINNYVTNSRDIYPTYNYVSHVRDFRNRKIVKNIPIRTDEEISNVIAPYKNNNQIYDEHLIKNDPDIIYVPDDYPTIQSAVENATAGDTIIVRDGSYKESIYIDKALTIISENGPGHCSVVQVNKNVNVFTIESDSVSLYGFNIKGVNYRHGIYLNHANHSIIAGNSFRDFDHCMTVYNSHNITINNNRLGSFWGVQYEGLTIKNSKDFTIENNTITDHIKYGLLLHNSKNNTISNNSLHYNNYNIRCDSQSNNNIFLNNSLKGSFWAEFVIYSSHFNKIINNTFRGATVDGLLLLHCSYNTIEDNTFTNDGAFVFDSYHNNFQNNIVNSKPLIYQEAESNKLFNESAGQIILVNCDDITFQNQDISDTIVGVELFNTNNSTISNSNIHSNNYEAIYAIYSDNNRIHNCTLSNCWHAIALYSCNGNEINSTYIHSIDWETMIIDDSHYNKIIGNNITDNFLGIELHHSDYNDICYNEIYKLSQYTYNGAIEFHHSQFNNITYNNIHHQHRGIDLFDSSNNNLVMRNTFNVRKNYVGQNSSLIISESHDNRIYQNNFISGHVNFADVDSPIAANKWFRNYWYKPRTLPKMIFGTLVIGKTIQIPIPWVNFDWCPAQEPYDIP